MKKSLILIVLIICSYQLANAQKKASATKDIFQLQRFIENKGQFDNIVPNNINAEFAYINQGEEVYITKTGIVVRLTQLNVKPQYEKADAKEIRELEERVQVYDRQNQWVQLNWLGMNPNAMYNLSGMTNNYYTYGHEKYNAKGFESVALNNIYNGVNVVYELHKRGGIEYTLVLQPGAKLSDIRYEYTGGNNVQLNDEKNEVIISSDIKPLFEKNIYAYYKGDKEHPIDIKYNINNGIITFEATKKIDPTKTLIIDPWVTTTTSLDGSPGAMGGENKAYDVDFDGDGNIFVIGGGGATGVTPNAFPKIAKFDDSGALLWTFSGQVVAPNWSTSPSSTNFARVGNLMVDKISGKTYVSQGLHVQVGAQIIRLDQNGNYDNFITVADPDFLEIWDMKFNCITNEVVGMGGGTSGNINFGIVDTITGAVITSNATGVAGPSQDIACATIDKNGDVFVIYASGGFGVNTVSNNIYSINATYTGFNWREPTGFMTLTEQGNKPFISAGAFSNGYNALAANENYIFYYDGINLRALDKTNGTPVGVPFLLGMQSAKMQGGIYANDCDEVYLGGDDGNILNFDFNGNTFIQGPDIDIAGEAGHAVYDIMYNSLNNLLYVSGDQFVAAIDFGSDCQTATTSFTLDVITSCKDEAVVNIINPDLMGGYTFIYSDSITGAEIKRVVKSPGDVSDIITGLTPGVVYKVTVILPSPCQINSAISYFQIIGKSETTTQEFTICPDDAVLLPDGSEVKAAGLYTNDYKDVNGCDSIIETTVFVDENLCPCSMVMPNAFSPNGDNNNETIKPLFICESPLANYEFLIFNRWGQMLFKTNDFNLGWDGKFAGEKQLIGTYFYAVKYSIQGRERERNLNGDVTLIR